MVQNPYLSPASRPNDSALSSPSGINSSMRFRAIAGVLLVFATLFAVRRLSPLAAQPTNNWPFENWLYQFIPAIYWLVAAVYCVRTEVFAIASRLWRVPLALFPIVPYSVVVFWANVPFAFRKGEWGGLVTVAFVCFLLWFYFLATVCLRWIPRRLTLRSSPRGTK